MPEVLQQEYGKLYKDGIKFYETRDYPNALEVFSKLITLNPEKSDPYANISLIKKQQKSYQSAFEYLNKALQISPKQSYLHANMGSLLREIGKYKDALRAFSNAIKLEPKEAAYYNNLGITYEKIGDLNRSVTSYKEAIRINPNFAKSFNNLGGVFYQLKKYEEAIKVFNLALQKDPKFTEVHSNIGSCYNKLKQYDEAITHLNISIKSNPKSAGAYTNLGNVYNKLDKFKKAAKLHEQSIELDPKGVNAYSNLANSHKQLGFLNKAEDNYKKAIELDPNFINAHFDLATTYLMKKDFLNGFKEYEWRFKKDEMKGHLHRHQDIFKKPLLTKDVDVKGKRVLIHSEQGFGDSIQFVRFVEGLKKEYGCSVILQCRDELKTLFENSIKNVDHFYARDSEELPEFDFQRAMMSLPYLKEVENIEQIPSTDKAYLFAKDEENLDIKKEKDKIYIGICWSASVTGESYEGKVFDLSYFEPLIDEKKIVIYSLQVGLEAKDIKSNGYEDSIVDITDKLTDFNKTAYLMNQLDLVISSDTSVAHLSGALGCQTWVPLQKIPDWRWGHKENESYLYPNTHLVRQKSFKKWDSVFQSIFAKLNPKYKLKIKS